MIHFVRRGGRQGAEMNDERRAITFWNTIKIAMVSAVSTALLWIIWDYLQEHVASRGGPSRNPAEYWFTWPIVYTMFQGPAALGASLTRLLAGDRMSPNARFVVHPVVSAVVTLVVGFFVGVRLDYPILWIALILIPKIMIYGFVFAAFDRFALPTRVQQSNG